MRVRPSSGGELDIDLLVLDAEQLDLVDVVHAEQFLADFAACCASSALPSLSEVNA